MVFGLEVLLPILATLIGGVVTYFTAVRKLSGKISTSSAEDLWAESRAMRRDLTVRISQLSKLVDAMQTHIDALEQENRMLKQDFEDCKNRLKGDGVLT